MIAWPSDNSEFEHISNGFERRRRLEKVIGALDGSHIPIKAPRQDQEVYINRKGFHSIVLQAVCNHRMVFMDCYAGWPGSTHDARDLRRSDLYQIVLEQGTERLSPYGSYLLGDSAYPLTTWLMNPFRDNGRHLEKERRYNFLHSSRRMAIERAFALLKGRFRRLKYVDMVRVEDFSEFVMAACVLHNICLASSDEQVEDMIQEGQDDSCSDLPDVDDIASDGHRRNEATLKRKNIMEHLWADKHLRFS